MKKVIIATACMFLLVLAFSCKNQRTPAFTGPVTIGEVYFKKAAGAGCDQPDTLRTDCLQIDLTWPNVEQGGEALKKSVSAWAVSFLSGILTPYSDEKQANPATVEAAANALIKSHGESVQENPDSPSTNWAADGSFNTLLNDGKHLTLEIGAFSFMGGAHGNPTAAVATFDALTGKKLALNDLVTDTAAFKTLAEKSFREERADIFKPTDGSEPFEFDATFPFALPQNYGLVEDGLYCHYVAYEVGPYAIGSTQVTIPFSELGALAKIAQPAPQPGSDGEVSDIYEVQGDSLVIPTFEIEVSNSLKASQTLTKQKETIIVFASFSGDPLSDKDRDEIGQMFITDQKIELSGNNRFARFEGIRFSKKAYAKLADKDISLLINIYSGRKSTQDNLLDCGLLEMKASEFGNKRFVLGCKLIAENPKGGTAGYPLACYALPLPEDAPTQKPALLVECSEKGDIEFAGQPMKDYDALMATLRTVLTDLKKSGAKELPDLATQGCMMGSSGEIRTRYEELKEELTGKGKATASAAEKEEAAAQKAPDPGSSKAAAATSKQATTPAKSTKQAAKLATAKPSTLPAVTVNQKGEITLSGKKVSLENLRKELQTALLAQAVIPDKLEVKSIGEVLMGTRGEVNTVVSESIAGAKWVRKKAAISALNTSVGKKLATSTQLELSSYQTNGQFAYLSAKPKQADGKAIDYSKTDYSKDAKSASFADNTIGLLKYENGAWKVLAYSIGVNKPPVDVWVKNYSAPKALF